MEIRGSFAPWPKPATPPLSLFPPLPPRLRACVRDSTRLGPFCGHNSEGCRITPDHHTSSIWDVTTESVCLTGSTETQPGVNGMKAPQRRHGTV